MTVKDLKDLSIVAAPACVVLCLVMTFVFSALGLPDIAVKFLVATFFGTFLVLPVTLSIAESH